MEVVEYGVLGAMIALALGLVEVIKLLAAKKQERRKNGHGTSTTAFTRDCRFDSQIQCLDEMHRHINDIKEMHQQKDNDGRYLHQFPESWGRVIRKNQESSSENSVKLEEILKRVNKIEEKLSNR